MFFVALLLTVAEIYLIIAAVAVVLWGLIELYYFIKEKIQNSLLYKVYKILVKLSNGEIQAIAVIRLPDGTIQIETVSKTFSESEMRGTPIEKAFEQAERKPESRIEGNVAVELITTPQEEDEIKRKAVL